MVLEIAGKLLGKQQDVRETPVSTATATAVGLVDGKYIVVDYHGDMSDERKITEGTGIDFTDNGANGTFVIALKNKTSYYAVTPAAWHAINPYTDVVSTNVHQVSADGDGMVFVAPVNLPHGAVVTNVIIYGNAGATGETWTLYRLNKDDATTAAMATAAFSSADAAIDNATIDNSTYTYGITSTSLDNGDIIYGGVITYTTDYD